ELVGIVRARPPMAVPSMNERRFTSSILLNLGPCRCPVGSVRHAPMAVTLHGRMEEPEFDIVVAAGTDWPAMASADYPACVSYSHNWRWICRWPVWRAMWSRVCISQAALVCSG